MKLVRLCQKYMHVVTSQRPDCTRMAYSNCNTVCSHTYVLKGANCITTSLSLSCFQFLFQCCDLVFNLPHVLLSESLGLLAIFDLLLQSLDLLFGILRAQCLIRLDIDLVAGGIKNIFFRAKLFCLFFGLFLW